MFQLLLFDIDGTLIRTGGAGEKAFRKVIATEFGFPGEAARLDFAGRTDTAILRDFFQHHEIDPSPENFSRFFDAYVFWLDHLLEHTPGQTLPGVERLLTDLQQLADPPVIGLLTGNIRLGAQIKLSHHGLWDYFVTGGFGDDSEDRARVAATALERARHVAGAPLHSREVLVIGDTPRDIACANAVGAHVLAVATGQFSMAELRGGHPTWLLPSLDGLSADALRLGEWPNLQAGQGP